MLLTSITLQITFWQNKTKQNKSIDTYERNYVIKSKVWGKTHFKITQQNQIRDYACVKK